MITEQLPVVEPIIATARAILALVSLIAIYFDPTQPSSYTGLAYALMIGYAAYSLVILIVVRNGGRVSSRTCWFFHAIDILWTAVIMTFTAGPNSAFFLFFVFTILSAAYRWDLYRTLWTAAIVVSLLFVEGQLLLGTIRSINLEGEFEYNRLIMRITYISLTAFLVGYLTDQEKTLRAHRMAVSRAVTKMQATRGFRSAICAVLDDIFPLFDIRTAWIAMRNLRNEESGGLWSCERRGETDKISTNWSDLESNKLQPYLFTAPGAAIYGARDRANEPFAVSVLYSKRNLLTALPAGTGAALPVPESSLRYLAVDLQFGDEWAGRLYLLDPTVGSDVVPALRFLSELTQQITPGLYSAYLVSRMRSRVGAVERSRVARELHDGVIQSMIGLELETAATRVRLEKQSVDASWLGYLQERLRQEIAILRDVMEQLKPLEIDARHMLPQISALLDRFQRQTQIRAQFLTDIEALDIPSNVYKELVRIVQEALVNVRKHSKATQVTVRLLTQSPERLQLVVEDDGRGFDAVNEPAVIKERASLIRGELTVDSPPGGGSRLTLTFPRKTS